jgi:hypothetical protein
MFLIVARNSTAQTADLEAALAQAGRIMTTAKNASLRTVGEEKRRASDDVEIFARLTYAQVTRLREIAATARPRHKTIFRAGEGSTEWRRLWASYDTHDEASDINTIELSARKTSLFGLYARRYDFRVSPRTATATARVFDYRSSCIGLTYCTEEAYVVKHLDMRSPEVRELFREELDHWIHEQERSIIK